MRFLEKVGRTVDSAVTDALIELGATRDEVVIDIIEKGSRGFLGLGARDAKVRVTIKESSTEDTLEIVKEIEEAQEVQEVKQPKEIVSQEEVSDNVNSNEEKAITFLKKVLKEMNIDATFSSRHENDKVYIDISGDKMGIVIGKRGETLDSLQYLTNIVVNKNNEPYVKVVLDTENYRQRREETLQRVALKYAKKATQLKRPVTLESMNPYDRRIIHSVLQNSKTVKTHSEGREPFRKVVITPIYQNKNYKK